MVWTTLDSLPILPKTIQAAPNIKNFYTWASFASKEMKRLGHTHVENLNGSIDVSKFYKLKTQDRQELRARFNLNQDDFIIGFVFRNQLRKSLPNLLDGFNNFIKSNPESKAKLLLHTPLDRDWETKPIMKSS